jgi:hypothetical protein
MRNDISRFILALAFCSSAHAAPTTLHTDANNCEFYVDGIASIYSYNMAWSRYVLHSEIVPLDPYIERFGQWIRHKNKDTGEIAVTEIIATPGTPFVHTEPGRWSLDFEYKGTNSSTPNSNIPNHFEFEILEFAYFAEKSDTSGNTVRLWVSDSGKNFSFRDTFSAPTYEMGRGRGYLVWTDQRKAPFHQKQNCAR